MKLVHIRVISLCIVCLLLLIPSFQILKKQVVAEECENKLDSMFILKSSVENSLLKKMWGFIELMTSIGLSIFITQLFSLRVLPIILEIGFGPVIFLLIMALLLTVPVQLVNGVCLHLQKQFSLGRFQTVILTIFSFFVYVLGNLIIKSMIPF